MTDHTTTHDAEEDARNRDILIYINGTLYPRDEAKVSVYDSGFLLGDGMWEGMRFYDGVWAFFDEHMDRFFDSCYAVGLDVGIDRAGENPDGRGVDQRRQRQSGKFARRPP